MQRRRRASKLKTELFEGRTSAHVFRKVCVGSCVRAWLNVRVHVCVCEIEKGERESEKEDFCRRIVGAFDMSLPGSKTLEYLLYSKKYLL